MGFSHGYVLRRNPLVYYVLEQHKLEYMQLLKDDASALIVLDMTDVGNEGYLIAGSHCYAPKQICEIDLSLKGFTRITQVLA